MEIDRTNPHGLWIECQDGTLVKISNGCEISLDDEGDLIITYPGDSEWTVIASRKPDEPDDIVVKFSHLKWLMAVGATGLRSLNWKLGAVTGHPLWDALDGLRERWRSMQASAMSGKSDPENPEVRAANDCMEWFCEEIRKLTEEVVPRGGDYCSKQHAALRDIETLAIGWAACEDETLTAAATAIRKILDR